MNKYVIIGNGTAATGCIEGIRSIDNQGSITVVSFEKHPAYCRPLISYYLEGKTDLKKMNYREKDFYKKTKCEVLYGRKAIKFNRSKKEVILDDGKTLKYTSVCVATGATPSAPKFKGLEKVKNVFNFITLDDALNIEKAINKTSKVLIVGSGLIGLKCAEGLKDRVAQVTVCNRSKRVLKSVLDEDASEILASHLEKCGLNLLLGDIPESFDMNNDSKAECPYKALMQSGKSIDFDVLILAVGTRPNTELILNAGGETEKGIVVNEKMQTSLSGIFAAGDCTESEDISSGSQKVMALMPNAYLQGNCAGVNMAGEEKVFDNAIPMNAVGFFGLHLMTAGTSTNVDPGSEIYVEKDEMHFKKLFTKDGFLTGFILIGNTERAGIYTSLIRNRIPLKSIDFELLKKTATSFTFTKEKRAEMFAGKK